ncbi:hypothetical protein PoB_001198400 [Plakobranchus ocellatus]|uniref:Uncharacterized protein n=1 Tax=Plakobranchus ocellatus TaxID=259542 RepID=A0AAV3YU71_9GAST|nr:hypothetical protein PoB_001198400 [Plakobranchus ocellatus]
MYYEKSFDGDFCIKEERIGYLNFNHWKLINSTAKGIIHSTPYDVILILIRGRENHLISGHNLDANKKRDRSDDVIMASSFLVDKRLDRLERQTERGCASVTVDVSPVLLDPHMGHGNSQIISFKDWWPV